MKCPYCKEEMARQLELLRREQDRGAAPGNMLATYICNTCAKTFRIKEPKDGQSGVGSMRDV